MHQSHTYNLVYKNSAVLTFLRLVEPGLAMVVIVAVSRVMGTEVMGGYAFIVTFISMFSVIGQMGLQALLTREVAADRTSRPLIFRRRCSSASAALSSSPLQ